jgi:hypothetical protein
MPDPVSPVLALIVEAFLNLHFIRNCRYLNSIDHQQKISLFALCYTVEVISASFHDAMAILEQHKDGSEWELGEEKRVRVFRAVWEIVEHIDALRQICRTDQTLLGPAIASHNFGEYFSVSKLMRNKKIHVAQNIYNIAEAKYQQPLHGLIKWTSGLEVSEKGFMITGYIMTIDPAMHKSTFSMPEKIGVVNNRVSNLILHAFDAVINISDFIKTLDDFIVTLHKSFIVVEDTLRLLGTEGMSPSDKAFPKPFFLKLWAWR